MAGEEREAALALWEQGFNVLPAARGAKVPLGSWKRWQTERIPKRDVEAGFSGPPRNIFIITGQVSTLAVLDCDNQEALELWQERLGDELETAQVQTGKGWHFYWRLPEGAEVRGRSGDGWDFRAEGGGVIAPPSVHPSGAVYQWHPEYGSEALRALPSYFLDLPGTNPPGDNLDAEEGAGRSSLAGLLADPPKAGNRNSWLTQVAGHYAKLLPHQDAYELHVREAADKLADPLDPTEVEKTMRSIWSTQENTLARDVQLELRRQRVRRRATQQLDTELAELQLKPAPLHTLRDLLLRPQAREQWAVKDLHEVGNNTVLTAEYKTGKTTMLMNLVKALVDDEPFLGQWPAKAQGRVALYDFEMTERQLQRWFADVGIQNTDRVVVIPLRGYKASLMTPAGQELTIKTLQKYEVTDWVIDPFGRALEGNENANDEVRAWTDTVDWIKREAGVQNLYVATHTGRVKHEPGQERARGATVLDDWTDNRWLLVRSNSGERTFRAVGRNGEIPQTLIDYNEHTRSLSIQGEVGDYDPDREQMGKIELQTLRLLSAGRKMNRRQLRAEQQKVITASKAKLDKAVDKLVEQGRLIAEQGQGNERLYRRTKASEQVQLEAAEGVSDG